MNFLELVTPSSSSKRGQLLAAASLSGLASTYALSSITSVTKAASVLTITHVLLFLLAVTVALVAARWTSHQLIEAAEAALHQLKVRIAAKVEAADLAHFERVGRAEILDRVSQNLTVITLAGSQLGPILQALIMFVLALGYMALLSPLAFLILLPVLVSGLYVYGQQQQRVIALLTELYAARVRFFNRLLDMIDGAKEIKLRRARGRDLGRKFNRISTEVRDISIETNFVVVDSTLFLTVVQFALLAALVFVIPQLITLEAGVVPELLIVLLFAWSSLQSAVMGYTIYISANEALNTLAQLEAKLEGDRRFDDDDLEPWRVGAEPEAEATAEAEAEAWHGESGTLELRALEFAYPDRGGEPGFRLGPLELRVEPGELLFIVGGNGAGKSTLLKLLTGLYSPSAGTVWIGGVPVDRRNVAAYRELISVIFTDVHLFTRAYGLLEAEPEAVNELLGELGIAHKTAFAHGQFSNRRLSSGQRKRLAMVVSMLEDRPIILLDEWAADQDPGFRAHFYEHMLPSLRRRGKTVIVVSHDDRYFHCADRVVKLDYGALRELDPTA
ncbi:cyclic peptide export ABC transporter [Enhygromyxa salina]|uniref:ABC transporter ATP-binding protein YojI n=1 Tax=Enhygromyxa salina TaxID=215803 RepID=A0A2S9YTM7_9BACT|nr:cyclic peptide export ABC transporter [Enhygromyxa salina]PRQ08461.1 ABC transporter ATP-binding protein YojI [Enhygromyxa salina]